MRHIDEDVHEWRARLARGAAGAPSRCADCDGKGFRWRVPDGFNPFSAGGWNTVNAMFKTPCHCAAPHTEFVRLNTDNGSDG